MTPTSAAATGAARSLWARAAGDTRVPEEVAAAVERMHSELRTGLGRWIGVEGYHALLDRAVGLIREEHPALDGVSFRGVDNPITPAAVRAHGASEMAAGVVALVAVFIELLGRIIGAEMAVRLVEQIGVTNPRGVVSAGTGGRDG